jgi:ubiquinone/menaquinone biosynthesis C-methylase UbiE
MGMIKKILKRLLQLPADALIASSKRLDERMDSRIEAGIINNPHVAAKYYPYEATRTSYLLRKVNVDLTLHGSELPIPPLELRVHRGSAEQYLSLGPEFIARMKSILAERGFSLSPQSRVLDLGCGDGMMIRAFYNLARSSEVWGVDIRATHVVWCQQHLSPPFKFVTTTSFPHLPFADSYFDLIYAGSVFTHIDDLSDAWLLELKRIVRPGGRLYLTVHDKHTIDIIYRTRRGLLPVLQRFDEECHFSTIDFAMFSVGRTPGAGDRKGQAQVFYDIDYLRKHWGNYLKVLSVTPEAYGYQTAVVLEKSSNSARNALTTTAHGGWQE